MDAPKALAIVLILFVAPFGNLAVVLKAFSITAI